MEILSQQILEDLKSAMKARDTATATVLRSLKSAVKYAAIEQVGAGGELDDAGIIVVVRKQIKQRRDSSDSFRKGGREDLAVKEDKEIEFLEKYLPAQPDAAEIAKLVADMIDELGAQSKADMGRVMQALQERTAGAVDNRSLSREVLKHLN